MILPPEQWAQHQRAQAVKEGDRPDETVRKSQGHGASLLLFMTFLWFMSFTSRTFLARAALHRRRIRSCSREGKQCLSLFITGLRLAVFLPVPSTDSSGEEIDRHIHGLAAWPASPFLFSRFSASLCLDVLIGAPRLYLPSVIPLLTAITTRRTGERSLPCMIRERGQSVRGSAYRHRPACLDGLERVFIVMGAALSLSAVIFSFVDEGRKGPWRGRFFGGTCATEGAVVIGGRSELTRVPG